MRQKIITYELFRATNGAVAQNGTLLSDEIDLTDIGVNGFFSLHVISLGGTLTVTVLVCSTRTGTYVAPTTPVTILSAKVAGTYFETFEPPVAPFMKLLFTETNVAAVTAMDAWLNMQ